MCEGMKHLNEQKIQVLVCIKEYEAFAHKYIWE